jgi:hypothetical protein
MVLTAVISKIKRGLPRGCAPRNDGAVFGMTLRSLRNDKGGMVVEAAIIFPIVILSAVLTVCFAVNLFCSAAYNQNIHFAVYEKADKETGNVKFEIERGSNFGELSKKIFKKKITVKEEKGKFTVNKNQKYFFLNYFKIKKFKEKNSLSCFAINEKKIKRNDLI